MRFHLPEPSSPLNYTLIYEISKSLQISTLLIFSKSKSLQLFLEKKEGY